MSLYSTLAVPNRVFSNICSVDFLNAVKKDILESRTLVDRIVDFFTPRDKTIHKYTERYHNALLSQFSAGFDSLKIVSCDNKVYTYEIENNGKVLTFSSDSLCTSPDQFARGLIIAAADENTMSPDIHDANNMSNDILFTNGNAYRLNLAPLDAEGGYYINNDNGILLVNTLDYIHVENGGHTKALAAMVKYGLKPMLVQIEKNEKGQDCILPTKNETIEYNGSKIKAKFKSLKFFEVTCDIRDLKNAIDFMTKCAEASSKTNNNIIVTGFDVDTARIFSDIASQPGNIVESAEASPFIVVRIFPQGGGMITVLFTDVFVKEDTQELLYQVATKVKENCVSANGWGFEQLRHALIGEQVFDSDEKFTDKEKSIMLARALTVDKEDIIYNSINESLLFNNMELKISLRTGSVGEGRGRHILDSLLEDENGTLLVDNEKLIKSLSYNQRNNYAIDWMSGKVKVLTGPLVHG